MSLGTGLSADIRLQGVNGGSRDSGPGLYSLPILVDHAMKQLVKTFSTIEEFAAFFSDEQTRLAMENARSVLAQVYVTARDHPWMSALLAELARLPDKVIVVGASTFGQLCDGKALNGTNVVCLGCFDTASLVQMLFECEPGQETAIGIELGRQLTALSEPLKGKKQKTKPKTKKKKTQKQKKQQEATSIPLF